MDMEKRRSSTTTIADLCDSLLFDIFVRLPSSESVITSKFVSKRWLSLLSDPKFVVEFINQKKKKNHLRELPWNFLKATRTKNLFKKTAPNKDLGINSGKFSVKFLRSPYKVAATFKDLVLSLEEGSNNFIICNPYTRHSVALPPTPPSLDLSLCWATLLCEDPFYNDSDSKIDYRFRVVVIRIPDKLLLLRRKEYEPSTVFNVTVFCSEDSQWKPTHVKVSLTRRSRRPFYADPIPFKAVVCKGMVCVCFNQYFGMFNPFHVTPTSTTTLEATTLPLPPVLGFFVSAGRLIALLTHWMLYPLLRKDENWGVALSLESFELDLNQLIDDINNNNNEQQQQVHWRYTFRGDCTDKTGSLPVSDKMLRPIGMHPTDKHLLYISTPDNKLVLCDRRSRSLKILGGMSRYPIDSNERLELQYWPTPVPTIPG